MLVSHLLLYVEGILKILSLRESLRYGVEDNKFRVEGQVNLTMANLHGRGVFGGTVRGPVIAHTPVKVSNCFVNYI